MKSEARVYNSCIFKTLGCFLIVMYAIEVRVGLKTYLSSLAFKVDQES